MNVDKIMGQFRSKAQELREKHEGSSGTAAILWDLNCWLHRRLNDEKDKINEAFNEEKRRMSTDFHTRNMNKKRSEKENANT